MIEFAERLKELREKHGFSQKYMAECLDISQPAYAKYEKNQAEPDYNKLRDIAQMFSVSLDDLLGNELIGSHKSAVVVYGSLGKHIYRLNNKQIMIIDALCHDLDNSSIELKDDKEKEPWLVQGSFF